MQTIRLRGARSHNLKNISLDIPRDRLVVITGISGSGKSSLAFDTLYAEGQRRYVESLSSYARQFLQLMEKPDVDSIDGLSPAVAIEQKSAGHNPRSTVGTITEIHDYLRLLYARAGTPYCPEHQLALEAQSVAEMVDDVLRSLAGARVLILAPLWRERKGEHAAEIEGLRGRGFTRLRVDGEVVEIDQVPKLARNAKHDLDVVVDRLRPRPELAQRLAESFETALALGEGRAIAVPAEGGDERLYSARHSCPQCDYALPELEPRLFSFNSPLGACAQCDGLGSVGIFDPRRIVSQPHLSLAAGAIRGWDRRNTMFFQLLRDLARFADFDLEQPFEMLSDEVQELVLHGSKGERIEFTYQDASSKPVLRRHEFEGVVANFERRHRDTDSPALREELARFINHKPCPACGGARLRREARAVRVGDMTLPALACLPLRQLREFFASLRLTPAKAAIAERIRAEIENRLTFLIDVGLDYLALDRAAGTLSGGEAQRIRLASQIGSGLTGVMYVLDEPSIGLHQRDNARLLASLTRLRDLGNSVLVVEHDEDTIRSADFVVDMGPGAGNAGGEVVAQGSPVAIAAAPESLTGRYLAGSLSIPVPRRRRKPSGERVLKLCGARGNNLREVDLILSPGLFVAVTGVSGSGKSTLVNDTLYRALARQLCGAADEPQPYASLSGGELFDKVIDVDQAPIGRTPRSNPATYCGLFAPIRELFAGVPSARERGYGPGRFSFNVKGGRCEACQGDGVTKVEMHFLPDLYVTCDACRGRRYNRETLEIQYRGKSIDEVLALTVVEAAGFFAAVPVLARKLEVLREVGLGYVQLGQAATTLSGGEAQRVKLALELSKRDTGHTLYILDEPTTGLHFHDVALLLRVLNRLVDQGNTVLVIEHNLDVIKTADWVVDLGPEGGDGGGRIVCAGTPEQVATCGDSYTGTYLAPLLPKESARRKGRTAV
jgi:excinuclease ABC subunit A